MTNITLTPHGKFIVKAGYVNSQIVARLFSAEPKAFRGHILEATGSSPSEATEQVIQDFDQMTGNARVSRRLDSITGAEVPTRFEFETVLRVIDVPTRALALLRKLVSASETQISLEDFARISGLTSAQEVIVCLENLGVSICAELACDVPTSMRHYIMLRIPTGEFPKETARLELQPEFAEALTTLHQGGQRFQSPHAA